MGIYAIIWKASVSQNVFEERIPALMDWLRSLHDQKRLRACGGWSHSEGGLTIIQAANLEEAVCINKQNPLSEIGTSDVYEWDLFYADLVSPWPL
jgi:uncharacterized protein YciI